MQILNCYLESGEETLQSGENEESDRYRQGYHQVGRWSSGGRLWRLQQSHPPTCTVTSTSLTSFMLSTHRTITHKLGGHLDQIFSRGADITNALVNDGFEKAVTDHNMSEGHS